MADTTYVWLPTATVREWLKVDGDDKATVIEVCRAAAAEWIEDQRPDRVSIGEDAGAQFVPSARILQAALLAAARLFARIDSPNGVVAFAELGAGSILSTDPDIRRMLGRPRPVFG